MVARMSRKSKLRNLVGTVHTIAASDGSEVIIRLLDTEMVRTLERIPLGDIEHLCLSNPDIEVIYPTSACGQSFRITVGSSH